jgi:general secretion pathway protein G
MKKNNKQYTIYKIQSRAFTLVELMIVVAVLGILAAIVIPEFQGHLQQAKEASAKSSLKLLREAIERYEIDNGVPPGYPDNNTTNAPAPRTFNEQLTREGEYLNRFPKNPFNGHYYILVVQYSESFPLQGTGTYGWIYKPATKEIRLDYPGTDSHGQLYYSY